MKKIVKLLLIVISLFANVLPALAEAVPASELIENAAQFDGKKIEYEGEAIGDIMQRKGGQWVNVLGDSVAIGVWSTNNLKDKIKIMGSYTAKGDRVLVRGTFNRFCRQHGGDLDIHADKISILRQGHAVEHKISATRIQVAILLAIGALLAFGFNFSRAKRYL